MKIGVISDTHNFLDPRIPELFAGVEHILHGGDIGQPWVIHELESIAPVTAVLGNNDAGLPYRETEVLTLAGIKILVHHIVDVRRPHQVIRERITRLQPGLVVFGHTHQVFHDTIDGSFFLNPGYSGKPRLNLSRSVALLHLTPDGLRPEILPL